MVIGIKYDGDDLECAIQFQQTDTSQLWRWRCWSRIHTIHWNSRSVCTISSFFTARQHTCSLLCRTPILAMTGSVRQTVCLTVRHTLVSCQKDSSYDHAVFMEDSPMTLVSFVVNCTAKFQREHRERDTEWHRDRKNTASMSQYPRYGARWDHGYSDGLIGSRISVFDFCQNQWPWMTLNGWCAL